MKHDSYWRAILFGSIVPCLIAALIFTAFVFSDKGWIPLIALVLGMYALPVSLAVSMLLSALVLRGRNTWVQVVTGLLVCMMCTGATALVLERL